MPGILPARGGRYSLHTFSGAPDTLRTMRAQAWGPRGEQSRLVRETTEWLVSGLWPKAYQSEILAIRNFATTHLRYVNDPLHVEWVRDPESIIERLLELGRAQVDCDEIAELIATMALQVGRRAEFVVVGFGRPGHYTHVFARVFEPKSRGGAGEWIVCDPVAGQDERKMLESVTTYELWSLDEHEEPVRGFDGYYRLPKPTGGLGDWQPLHAADWSSAA